MNIIYNRCMKQIGMKFYNIDDDFIDDDYTDDDGIASSMGNDF